MKIVDLICSAGRTGFYFDDQRAIKGGAGHDGIFYVGAPVTEGFTAVRQAGESISVMLVLEDGQVAYGDCAAVQYSGAGGRDPLFLAKDFIPVIEQYIKGREMSVGIFEGKALPSIEIIPKEGFYDYENKYQAGMTTEICPAPLTEAETAALAEATCKGFEALRLRGYSRFDFILDENGTPWCLEANTLPGMTPTSLLPQAAAAAGISYDELCERVVMMAVNGKA